jgi:hypothetical protein
LTIIDKFKGGPVGFYFGWPYQKVVKLFEVWAIPDSGGFLLWEHLEVGSNW